MISVNDALEIILKNCIAKNTIDISILDAEDLVLAENIYAPVSLPPFQQSAMDGYAVKLNANGIYKIVGEIQAGNVNEITLKKGEAVRIFTGAKVPLSADAVIMKEHTVEEGNIIKHTKEYAGKTNIKLPGEQIEKNDLALVKGTFLNSAALAYIAALGIANVKVYKRPEVAILITGNEVQMPGSKFVDGKIYDSNSIMLQMLLKKLGVKNVNCFYVLDEMNETVNKLKNAIDKHDIIIASGGISVGDYDLMQRAFKMVGVQEHFYKINQKPGKPIYFGTKGRKVVFGLPGNPAACFINFQVYVATAIQMLMGYKIESFKKTTLNETITNYSGKALFLRGNKMVEGVTIFANQSSSMLSSLIDANVLVYIPAEITQIEKRQEIRYLDILQ